MLLDESSATSLKKLMEEILAGWALGRVLFQDAVILWLVTVEGKILFSLEELYIKGDPARRPRYKNFSVTKNMNKLGHPSLVGGADARIGGEIYFEPREPAVWYITNLSGRYGLHSTRSSEHLENVKRAFVSFGINLETDFVGP